MTKLLTSVMLLVDFCDFILHEISFKAFSNSLKSPKSEQYSSEAYRFLRSEKNKLETDFDFHNQDSIFKLGVYKGFGPWGHIGE